MWPLLPTSFAVIAGSTRQVAMSRTLEPTLISARSVNRLVTFSAPLSIDFYHHCLLLATLSQFWRSASLYCFESSVDN